jgi:phage terminase small subunit
MALTAKQQAFIDEYLKTRNATQAAIAAGYTPKSACAIGWENLRKPEIDEEIRQRLDENAMLANEVVSILSDQARGDMSDFVLFVPGVKLPLLDLKKAYDNGKFKLIKKLKYTADGAVEFELYDAQAALIQLGKVHRLFTEKQEVNAVVEDKTLDDEQRADRIAALLDRARARRDRRAAE